MGKGDIKTRRGKFFAGSFGKRRPRKKKKPLGVARPVEKPQEITSTDTAPKKESQEQKKPSPSSSKSRKAEEKPKTAKEGNEETKENKENAE